MESGTYALCPHCKSAQRNINGDEVLGRGVVTAICNNEACAKPFACEVVRVKYIFRTGKIDDNQTE